MMSDYLPPTDFNDSPENYGKAELRKISLQLAVRLIQIQPIAIGNRSVESHIKISCESTLIIARRFAQYIEHGE
jgi:hypothetical protein